MLLVLNKSCRELSFQKSLFPDLGQLFRFHGFRYYSWEVFLLKRKENFSFRRLWNFALYSEGAG